MRKQLSSTLVTALFLALCLLPSLGLLLFGESGASANEQLSQRPRWGLDVLNETADYFADRFALRREMATLWARLNALFGASSEEQVLLGRGGWLYYAPTLADYQGERLSDAELERIAGRLLALQQEAEERGARFLFTVAPNKNTLYPEHMPAWAGARQADGNLARLLPLLDQYGVSYVDLRALALPYYRTDSHWTAQGAARAADALLAHLGRESGFAQGPFAEEGVHLGDLYEMLYPAARGAEPELVYTGALRHECLNDPRGGNAITIRTACAGGEGRLFCWRDSFGVALYPYLAESFAEARFSRSQNYQLPEGDWDVLLLEIVERNLSDLLLEDTNT